VGEGWEFLWEVGVRAVVEVPVLEAVSSLAWAASGVEGRHAGAGGSLI